MVPQEHRNAMHEREDQHVANSEIRPDTDPARSAGRLPPFASLRAFDAVFRCGGIRKAAAQLGLNHAVVSRHIRLLEDWLGIALVARSGNRLTLTQDGSAYHMRISAALAEMILATEELTERRDNRPLKLWCAPGFATQWLSAQLVRFEREHPEWRVELKPSDAPANLLVHEADADIRFCRYDSALGIARGLRSYEFARPELLPLASPQLAAELEADDRKSGLLEWPFLHDTDDSEWCMWLRENGHEPPDPLPGMLYWHSHLTIAAAREGRGVVLASRFLVDADLKQGTLVRIKVRGARPAILGRYLLFAREDRWSNPILVQLREFLRASAAALLGEKA